MSASPRITPLVLVSALIYLAFGGPALCAQVVDGPGFKALPQPIRYDSRSSAWPS